MKTSVIFGLLAFSTLSFASTVSETIKDIEFKKNAKCERISIGTNYCVNLYCLRSDKLVCDSNSGIFKVKLKVRTRTLANGQTDEFVTKVKYL